MKYRDRSSNPSSLTQNDFDQIQQSIERGYSLGEALHQLNPSSGMECSLTDMLVIAQRRSIGTGRRQR